MSMTLILWKAPRVSDGDEAQRLLAPYYDREDDSAFEPSEEIGKVAAELLERFPESEHGPWADSPEQTERILLLGIRWGADDAVLEAVEQLAREHGLVLYDPQGPTVHLPTDPIDTSPTPPPGIGAYVTVALVGLVAAGAFLLGWRIDVPVLDWVLMIAGGFGVSVVVFLLGIFLFGPREDAR